MRLARTRVIELKQRPGKANIFELGGDVGYPGDSLRYPDGTELTVTNRTPKGLSVEGEGFNMGFRQKVTKDYAIVREKGVNYIMEL